MRQLDTGTRKLAKGLAGGANQIPDQTKSEVTELANVASFPVAVRPIALNNPGAYGAGFASPCFMSLAKPALK